MNIGLSLSRNAKRVPEKTAIFYDKEMYTYEQLNREVNKLAHGLLDLGIEKGDKIAFMMKNSDKFMIVYYAVMKVGAIAVPVNFRLTANEVAYILDDSDACVVFFDDDYAGLIREATKSNKKVNLKIAVDGEALNGQLKMEEILHDDVTDPDVSVEETDDAEILYTSGTTGAPKGAIFDHHRVLHVGFNTAMMMKINPDDNLLHVAPLFHSAQLNLFMVSGIYLGCTQVIHQEFDPEQVLQTIEQYKISMFFAVPTMYNFLLQVPNKHDYDLTSVTRCGYGAAPMPVALLEQAMELFATDQFYNMTGQTEGGPGAGVILLPEEHEHRLGTAGKVASLGAEVRVVTDQGEDVLPGQVGEFIIRGETVMKRYYNKPEETKRTLKNGWLYSGDLATVDEDGYISLVDRKKDMIITGGENVYSTEVEQALFKYPKLLDAAVVGIPDEFWGEKIIAVIVPKNGEKIDHQDLRNFCKKHLANYKVPVEFVEEDELPRNASGKVLKYSIRKSLT